MPCTAENGFFPELPETVPDMIYLCFPNNPTGMAATKEQLKPWVDYANEHGSVILYDAAYRAYMSDPELPRTIYEIPGAETCAIEFCSFSKTAGFTGTRCGWTVIPRALGAAARASTICGCAARAPSSTARPTSSSARPRRPTATRARRR